MRSFVLATRLPHPLQGGPDFRTWMVVGALGTLGRVGVFGIAHRPPEASPDDVVSMWRTTSQRTAVEHNAQADDMAWVSDPDWRPSHWLYDSGIEEEVNRALAEFAPDLVVLEQLGTAGYLAVARDAAGMVILNNHNVETDLQHQIADTERAPVRKVIRRQFAERTELLERDTLSGVNQVWACSEHDQRLLTDRFAVVPPIQVVPNGVPVSAYDPIWQAQLTKRVAGPRLVFPAEFGYLPNRQAAEYLITDVLPVVLARMPSASLALPGGNPSRLMVQAASELPIDVPGQVPSMHPYLRKADVMVVPLLVGSGTRLKVLEAFAGGIPVVSTPKGVEGLAVDAGVHFAPAETPSEFAKAVSHVHQSHQRRTMRRAARRFVEEFHSLGAINHAVSSAIESLGSPSPIP